MIPIEPMRPMYSMSTLSEVCLLRAERMRIENIRQRQAMAAMVETAKQIDQCVKEQEGQ